MLKISIVNPANGALVAVDEWAKEKNPQAAHLIAISYDNGNVLYISKERSEEDMEWPEAMEYAKGFAVPEINIPFRAPTRREALDMADAKDCGIMEALELIGGNALDSGGYWTCEKVSNWLAARYNAANAWFYYGYYGDINTYYYFYNGLTVVPVALYSPSVYEAVAKGARV